MLGMGFSTGWADPKTGQLWPPVDPATGAVIGSGMVSAQVVAAVPAVARAMGVITGRTTQMPLTLWQAGQQVKPAPRLLSKPDPLMDYPTLMSALWWDYMIHGNAVLYDTVSDGQDKPLAAMWLPAERVSSWEADGQVWYQFGGTVLDPAMVHHVKRRLDPWRPWRGIGVLEQHMRPFARISDQEAYSSRLLRDSAVPSIAITAGTDMSQDEADAAKKAYMEKFGRPTREPIFLPYGSTISPLGWSPKDAEISELQKASRGDVADMFNLDRWYLGVNDGSFNYKTYSAMSLALVKDTLGEHMRTFEQVLTAGWCDPELDQEIRLDPSGVIVDDKAATVQWLKTAADAGFVTKAEARAELGLPPLPEAPDRKGPEELATMVQKIYLGVGKVITAEEARGILNDAGADLGELPAGFGETTGGN